MEFDWVFVNPFHLTGFSASLYSIKDYYAMNPRLVDPAAGPPEAQLRRMIETARELGLKVMMDLVINHTAFDSPLVGIGPADVHNRDPRNVPLVCGGASVIGNGILAKAENANLVFCQFVPWQFDHKKQMNLKRTFRRASRVVTRLAANMGVAVATPLLAHFHSPVEPSRPEQRWLDGLYLDMPEEWDDPYRFFRW